MPTDHRTKLASIKRFNQLIAYLRDEMGWPINNGDSFENLMFDYTPEELGIDEKNAAKIQEIKRLRPLSPNQPWGIFFVKFEPKKLPVVALRRILNQVALKKRASANKSERAAWASDDLLFVSNYGEGEERQISFAHFARAQDGHDLPTLKVLGWDNRDTALHLDEVARELSEHLSWPDDDGDTEAWRTRWRAAFSLGHREVVATSKELSIRLAELARNIRDRIKTALAIETDKGSLTQLMKAFQTSLVHDLDTDGFADMYAQTIAYGLLSARIADPNKRTADDFAAHMRTNPFLRELMETFLKVGGRRGKAGGPGIDFDELGVSEVVELLDDANMEAVIRDFGDRNPQEDPVIHFYELFLKEYDPKKRMQRGVFYTPRPVVSFIVRSVDELLRTEFGLTDGLADTTTWGEMVKRREDIKIPAGVSPDQDFIQILDPATGTGTFLVEVIDLIHKTLVEKWKAEGHGEKKIDLLWNEYVPKHLLTRLHGYELLMAPYAIAHLKIGLKLYETGYRFGSNERARVYLTNSLEPFSALADTKAADLFEALGHEAQAVNEIKFRRRFTVVIGNPPYSNLSANLTETARALIEKYKFIGGERVTERNALQLERNLNDDYVKFIAWSEDRLRETGLGILSMISNNVYTWSPSLRGMRCHLLGDFPYVRILDLHGASQRGPADARFADDENVFDIEQPVAIGVFYKPPLQGDGKTEYAEVTGNKDKKYQLLLQKPLSSLKFHTVLPTPPAHRFAHSTSDYEEEYLNFVPLTSICRLFAEAFKSGRDWLVTDFEDAPILERMAAIQTSKEDDDALCERIGLSRKKAWNFTRARAALTGTKLNKYIARFLYRPFDERSVFYHSGWIASASAPVMRNLNPENSVNGKAPVPNLAILAGRTSRDRTSRLYWCSRTLTDKGILSSLDNASVFPALVLPSQKEGEFNFGEVEPEANLSKDFLDTLNKRLSLQKPNNDTEALIRWTFGVFEYIYAILWAPSYRARYGGALSADFPYLPLARNIELFRLLTHLGGELVALHLLESPNLAHPITEFIGGQNPEVEKVSWSRSTVWIDKAQTTGFKNVREDVWNFRIGGYQVCEKWLKDRKGRTLSKDDIAHYQKIVVALSETIRLMKEIDEVIEEHGGWPGAFQVSVQETDEASAYSMVAEPAPSYDAQEISKGRKRR
jgi:predicted helicase